MFVSAVFFLDSFKLFVGRILDVKYLQLLPRWILKSFLRIRVLKSSLDLIVKIRFRYKWLRKLLQICIFIFIIISRKIKIAMVKKTIECNKRYNKSRKTTLKHIHLHFHLWIEQTSFHCNKSHENGIITFCCLLQFNDKIAWMRYNIASEYRC